MEWLLSDAPIRIYREFAENNQGDNRLKTLSTAFGGITSMLTTWLGTRSEFRPLKIPISTANLNGIR